MNHRDTKRAEQLNIGSDLEQKLAVSLTAHKLYEFNYENPFFGDNELRRKVQKQTPFHPLSKHYVFLSYI